MPVIRVAIAGLGAIGRVLARSLADGIPGLVLAGAAARDVVKAQAWLDAERITCPLVEPEAFPALADAGGRKAGDGALRWCAFAATRTGRASKGARRADHRADRRASGAGRGHR